jgi:hypothetical protein
VCWLCSRFAENHSSWSWRWTPSWGGSITLGDGEQQRWSTPTAVRPSSTRRKMARLSLAPVMEGGGDLAWSAGGFGQGRCDSVVQTQGWLGTPVLLGLCAWRQVGAQSSSTHHDRQVEEESWQVGPTRQRIFQIIKLEFRFSHGEIDRNRIKILENFWR